MSIKLVTLSIVKKIQNQGGQFLYAFVEDFINNNLLSGYMLGKFPAYYFMYKRGTDMSHKGMWDYTDYGVDTNPYNSVVLSLINEDQDINDEFWEKIANSDTIDDQEEE